MLSSTLKDYKEKYKSRLLAHKQDYEDNNETTFLELELNNYTSYYNSLISIFDHFKNFTVEDKVNAQIHGGIARRLKKIDEDIYYNIVTELKEKGVEIDINNLSEEELMKDLIKIDFVKLNNHITSAKRILEFIGKKKTNPQETDLPENESDVAKTISIVKSEQPENPYHRVFTSYEAFLVFDRLKTEFGNTAKNLSNYSFIYYKMKKDGLIYSSISQLEYIDFLAIFDIHISRIKGVNELGNLGFRESIYSSVK